MVKRYYETVFVARHLSVRGRIRRDLIDVSPVAPDERSTAPPNKRDTTRLVRSSCRIVFTKYWFTIPLIKIMEETAICLAALCCHPSKCSNPERKASPLCRKTVAGRFSFRPAGVSSRGDTCRSPPQTIWLRFRNFDLLTTSEESAICPLIVLSAVEKATLACFRSRPSSLCLDLNWQIWQKIKPPHTPLRNLIYLRTLRLTSALSPSRFPFRSGQRTHFFFKYSIAIRLKRLYPLYLRGWCFDCQLRLWLFQISGVTIVDVFMWVEGVARRA